MDDKELFRLLGFVKISSLRTKTLKSLEDSYKIPSEIAKNTNIKTSQVSGALLKLKEKNLVVCLNEDAKKGRIYAITDLGKEVLVYLDE